MILTDNVLVWSLALVAVWTSPRLDNQEPLYYYRSYSHISNRARQNSTLSEEWNQTRKKKIHKNFSILYVWGLHDPRGLRAEGSAGSLYTPLDMTTPFKSASYCCVLHFYQSLGTLVIVKSVLRVIPLGWRLSSIYFFSWNLLFSDSDL